MSMKQLPPAIGSLLVGFSKKDNIKTAQKIPASHWSSHVECSLCQIIRLRSLSSNLHALRTHTSSAPNLFSLDILSKLLLTFLLTLDLDRIIVAANVVLGFQRVTHHGPSSLPVVRDSKLTNSTGEAANRTLTRP